MSSKVNRTVKFKELLVEPVRNGIYKQKEFHGRGCKIINMGELFSFPRLLDVSMKRVELTEKEQSKSLVQQGDLLFARRSLVAEGAGRCSIVSEVNEPTTFESSIIRARPNPALVSSDYLYYFFSSRLGRELMGTILRQMAVSGITGSDLMELEIECPELEQQKAIAAFLSALDDRITLLRETNATLEAIAQALFKSWFVDFDPVRAKAEGRARQDGERSGQPRTPPASDLPWPGAQAGAEAQGEPQSMDATTAALFPDSFEESELGLVPKGWRVGKVEDVMDLPYGKALKSTDRIDGVIPVYGSGGITGYHNESLVDGPSVIVGRKGTVGSLYWEDRPFFPIDTVFYVKAKQPLTYCYYLLKTLGLEGMNTDGAVPGLNRNNAYRLQVTVPSVPALQTFDEIVAVVREKIFANSQQAQTLTQLRDTLLPRLISGQLRLPAAEALVAEACA